MNMQALGRLLLAGAAVAALSTACNRGGVNPGGFGTITGKVTKGPTCPVQHVGEDCTAAVVGVAVSATGTGGRPAISATTDANGVYTLRLIARGPVTLHVDAKAAGAMSCPSPTVTPQATKTVTQDISCDTGIR